MPTPKVKHVWVDEDTGLTFHVMAYRQLSDAELGQTIRAYFAKRTLEKKPHKGVIVRIFDVRQ